ncbi:MAG: hypothetical protein IH840_11890, partial [Candidatus Heimdallarchaeota archaeon]|nr:hypothetical protein [Candidatus Heimdallarchaeota archaeon]
QIDPKDINRYLGTKFSSKRMVELLRSRTLEARGDGKKILVQLPPWRAEVLHWVDLSEEIAIAAGYNNLGPTNSQVVTVGKIAASSEDENLIRQILIGFGLIEVLNYNLTDLATLSTMVRRDENWIKNNSIQISNPVSLTRSIVRTDLLPGLIRFEARNTHVEYPHRIFETGECVLQLSVDTQTITNASVLLCGNDETFETILSIFDSLFRLLKDKYTLRPEQNHYYIEGRSGGIYLGLDRIGHLGEIHPEILASYGIQMPASAFEINLCNIENLQIKEMKTNES